ncbi:MAG TPA: hypothetical protein H9694_08785 [Firmicutes bacterium]|nr:hypothetical protein [Bacillota bacterium]
MSQKDFLRYSSSRSYDNEDDRELYDELFEVASSMECTGLIPAAPESSAEVDSYSEIYDIPLSGSPNKPARKSGIADGQDEGGTQRKARRQTPSS